MASIARRAGLLQRFWHDIFDPRTVHAPREDCSRPYSRPLGVHSRGQARRRIACDRISGPVAGVRDPGAGGGGMGGTGGA
jgi:hypothetical protein